MILNKAFIRNSFLIITLLFNTVNLPAQLYKYYPDKTGKLIIENNLNNCPGVDISSLKNRLTIIVEWFHQNDALISPPKGFNANISLFGNPCSSDAHPLGKGYGIMCSFNLSFRYFYAEKGVFHTASGWSAHDFDINVNQPLKNILAKQFGDSDFESDDDTHFKESLHTAYENLQQFFSVFQLEKVVGPGVRLYKGGHIVVSDPDRAEIFTSATVKEIMTALLNYYKIRKEMDGIKYQKAIKEMAEKGMKLNQDNNQMYVYDLIAKEYAIFTPAELNKKAFINAGDGISGINCNGIGNMVVKFNPDCWDLNLAKSAVQFVSMDYKPGSKDEMDEFSRDNNQLTDYVSLFMNELPIEKMGEMIKKK